MRALRSYNLLIMMLAGLCAMAPVSGRADENLEFTTPFKFTPFTEELPVPPVVKETAPFDARCSMHLPEGLQVGPTKFYEVTMKENTVQIIPGVNTTIWGYDGHFPGPTFKVKHNEPAIVRFHNELNATTIVHNHGGHQPAESDGSASLFPQQLIPPGESRDFCYPNIAPVEPATGEQDMTEFNTTQWYHDHAHLPFLDIGITGQNVYMGLKGFYLLRDQLEQDLVDNNVLPADRFDIPIVVTDRTFAPDGSLIYNEADFNGILGDVFIVNGKAQPVMHVQRRKYRFRILNGAVARWWELRLSTGQPMLQIGADSDLLGEAVIPVSFGLGDPRTGTARLAIAERADVIIDFSNAPDELFLENILSMRGDGRGPDDVSFPGVPVMKFVVEGPPVENDATVTVGTPLRPHKPIGEEEIVATRVFEFQRKGGEWVINGELFSPFKDNAQPIPNTAERWILRNGGGGWSHPIHIHMENGHVQKYKLFAVPPQDRFKKDTFELLPGQEVEVFIKFRTFTGRYVFHCHQLQHEDHAMMGVFNVGSVPVDFSNIEEGTPGNIPAVQPDKGEPVPPPAAGNGGSVQAPLVFEPGENAVSSVPPGPFEPEVPDGASPPEFGTPG